MFKKVKKLAVFLPLIFVLFTDSFLPMISTQALDDWVFTSLASKETDCSEQLEASKSNVYELNAFELFNR